MNNSYDAIVIGAGGAGQTDQWKCLISEDGSGQDQEEQEGCDDGGVEEEDFAEQLLLFSEGEHQPGRESGYRYHERPDDAYHNQESGHSGPHAHEAV